MYAPNSTEGRVSREATRQQSTGTYPVQMDSAETGARAQRSLSESPGSKSRAPAHSGSRSRQTPRGRLAPGAWGGGVESGFREVWTKPPSHQAFHPCSHRDYAPEGIQDGERGRRALDNSGAHQRKDSDEPTRLHLLKHRKTINHSCEMSGFL